MNNELKDIFIIQKVLKASGYYDISRISKEIYDFSEGDESKLENILQRIKSQEPWEYICNKCEFYNSTFFVNNNTLIPRIETEELVNIALEEVKNNPLPFRDIVDVGTGSGCIIISLKKELPLNNDLTYYATDISPDALDIAKANEETVLHSKEIIFVNTDLIENLDIKKDVLFLANLPYIPTDQYNTLNNSVKEYELRNALDGGKNGLRYYEILFSQIEEKGIKQATIICEIEPSTLRNMKELILQKFHNPTISVKNDQFNKQRFVLIHLY